MAAFNRTAKEEVEEPAKQEVEDKTILIPVLSEDITEEAVKVFEETVKVLNTKSWR